MSQRLDERVETKPNLDVYTKCLELTKYSMEVCKPKTKKDKNGKQRESNHHIPTRYTKIGEMIVGKLFDMGGIILEANERYVGSALNPADKCENLMFRIDLEDRAVSETYYIEHIVRTLNEHREFAESTFNYWIGQIVAVRKLLIAWRDSDKKSLKGCALKN